MFGLALIMLSCVTEVAARRLSIFKARGLVEAGATPGPAPKASPGPAPGATPKAAPAAAPSVAPGGAGPVVDVTAFGARPNDPLLDNAQVIACD